MENVIIQASAGTGKTHQLACRYLLLLFSGVRPENILATTFTKKAAGEILNRILTRLAKAAYDKVEFEKLKKDLSDSKALTQKEDASPVSLTIDEVQNTLYDLIKNLNRVNISTLDSYFNQRVQCFSLELELPMNWRIVNDSQDKLNRQIALSRMFQKEKNVRLYTQYMQISQLKRSVFDQMQSYVQNLYSLWKEAPKEAWDVLRVPVCKIKDEEFQDLLDKTITLLSLYNVQNESGSGKRNVKADLDYFEDFRQSEVLFGSFMDFFGHAIGKNCMKIAAHEKNVKVAGAVLEDKETIDCLIKVTKYAEAYVKRVWKGQSDFYREALKEFDDSYTNCKMKAGELIFEDIPWLLIQERFRQFKALDSFRMDGSIHHLLLDEFQDTSLTQWRVLESIAKQTAKDSKCSFFCVGDSKQAIYGWRGGETKLLGALPKLLSPAKINVVEMTKSYRSGPAIMEAVNRVFQDIDNNPVLADFADNSAVWGRPFIEHKSSASISRKGKPNEAIPSYVELSVAPVPPDADNKSLNSEELRTITYKHVAEKIKQLHDDTKELNLSIGVLVKKNTAGALLADCIKQCGLECSLEGKSPLLDSFEVCQILALMKWIDHPGDVYSYYLVSQSALAESLGIKDRWNTSKDERQRIKVAFEDCELLNRIRYELFRDGYGLTVQRWVEVLKPEADERSRRRLEMLEELAGKYDSQGSVRTDDFINYIESTSVSDAFNARIRIMTYHQSKGLEFDMVFLPQLDESLVSRKTPPVIYGRPDLDEHPEQDNRPNEIIRYVNSSCRYLLPKEQEDLFYKNDKKQMQESLCNLYVAMTRAKQALYMISTPPRKGESHKTYGGVLFWGLANKKAWEAGTVYEIAGTRDWIERTKLIWESEENQEKNQTVESSPRDGNSADGEPIMPLRGEKREVIGKFEFKKGVRSVCIPLPASAWTTKAKPSFVKVVSAEVDNLESSGSLLSQSMRGTLFHRWLADIKWMEEYRVDDQNLIDLGIGIGLQKDSFISLLPAFKALLKHPTVISALKRLDESWEAHQEKNVAGILEAEKSEYLVSGVIDRLTVHRVADGKVDKAIILDYKTVHEGSEASDVRARYAGQMDAYRQIVAQMYRIPVSAVETVLLVLEGNF